MYFFSDFRIYLYFVHKAVLQWIKTSILPGEEVTSVLQIKNICRTYRTGELVQKALDDVSLNLRDNEFVAVLGPSGSGKTTLLNIVGGLDRYDSGDLIINNVSTKQYRDRDWDAYRNHSIGFVFQSYNLIPHQTILSNVELALTISGVGRAERRRRAVHALEQVGLGDQLHKRPNQLSGGQMQRVAIARALVNDPAILLADEPTGALDTETSLQVMELLREVAKDRLVVMVTHNPELAEAYATRIVRLKDGRIQSDSDPCPAEEAPQQLEQKRPGRASMSFLTAISLSFNNLRTKLTRTLLTAFAGSIGIIGIALILSMSNGVDHYIQSVEEETLKSYPLKISDSTFDLTRMYDPGGAMTANVDPEAEVTEWKTFTTMFSGVNANDLGALRHYFEEEDRRIYQQVQAIEYDYGVTPHIYARNGDQLRQINPDNSFAAMGFTQSENAGGLLSAFSSTDSFRPMPEESSLYLRQYDLKAGHWPESCLECVVVLTANGRVPDMSLYALGLKDPKELDDMVAAFASGGSVDPDDEEEATYAYQDFLGIELLLLHTADFYTYDETYGVWTDRSADSAFLEQLAKKNAETLTIVGVVQPKNSGLEGCLTTGIAYPASLTAHLIEYAAQSEVVKAQRKAPEINVFTGRPFGETASEESLSLDSLIHVDEDAMQALFEIDEDSFALDASAFDFSGFDASQLKIDPSAFAIRMPSLSADDLAKLLDGVELQLSSEQLQTLFNTLLEGYLQSAANDPSTDFSQLPAAIGSYLRSDAAGEILRAAISAQLAKAGEQLITADQLMEVVQAVSAGYPAYLEAQGLSQDDVGFSVFAAYLQSDIAQAILNESAASLRAQFNAILPTGEDLAALADALYQGYPGYADENGLPNPDQMAASFTEYLQSDEAKSLILQTVTEAVDLSGVTQRAQTMFSELSADISQQLSVAIAQVFSALGDRIADQLRSNLESFSTQLSEDLRSAFTLDPDQVAELFTMNMDMRELRDLFTTLLSGEGSSYRGNLRKLGYGDQDSLRSIIIYPKDFESKANCKQIIEDYNRSMQESGQEDKVIVYTDMVETLMRSVTEIVNAISIVLIAFVAVSLVVSSIMIGIITYISVLERTKEIGILRAIGASKRNISSVFNAETFLVGLCAGILGVGITLLLLIPVNAILRGLTGLDTVKAILPVGGAIILVLLSMGLTLIAGLIPSRKAAKKDPVTALRTE